MRIVLDASVLIAAFATHGLCEAVYHACLTEHDVVTSEHLLREVRMALRDRIKLGASQADDIVGFIQENALLVKPAGVEADACRDPNDLPVLGTVLAARADCLVTGDQDLPVLNSFQSVPILSPRGFHEWLKDASQRQ